MDQSQIDRVLEMNNIVDVIGNYIPLKKSGSNYKARCPFHEEKTPSFMVSEKKQIYKCFGCGKAGNALTFIRDYEKISFLEALKMLAARVGISIEAKAVDKKKQTRQDLVFKIYALATSYYKQNLRKFGSIALKYLQDRKISETTIAEFELGFALDSYSGLKNFLLKNEIKENLMSKTGLFSDSRNGVIDLFRNRLIFPIYSITDKIVAFGARKLSETQTGGKYINSPTTDIYQKGSELYGLHKTRYKISKSKYSLVVEGYLDFLRLHETGFKNSVAALGTSLTDSQINKLSRYSENIYLLFDGDLAGKKAAIRAAGNIIKNGFNAKIIDLPETEDPDSFLLKFGADKLKKAIDEAKDLSLFLHNDSSLQMQEKEKIDSLIEIMNDIKDEISKEIFGKKIAEIFRISENAVRSRISRRRKNFKAKETDTHITQSSEEKELLKILINDQNLFKKVAQKIDSDYFFSSHYKKIFELISKNWDKMKNFNGLFHFIDNEIEEKLLSELFEEGGKIEYLPNILDSIILRKYQNDLKKITEKISQNILEKKDNRELYKSKSELKKKISALSKDDDITFTLDNKKIRKTLY